MKKTLGRSLLFVLALALFMVVSIAPAFAATMDVQLRIIDRDGSYILPETTYTVDAGTNIYQLLRDEDDFNIVFVNKIADYENQTVEYEPIVNFVDEDAVTISGAVML